ncbi:hypothetical protein J6590_075759 [Homalodisca vitripennis]|nr:hypothetical protein J6590_075759 [Homalodisca vitripennis]
MNLKKLLYQVEDSTGTDNMTWLAVPSTSSQSSLVTSDNFADEEICSTRQGSSTDNEGQTNKRRVVNKVSPKKSRRKQKGLSRQERSKKAKNEGKSYYKTKKTNNKLGTPTFYLYRAVKNTFFYIYFYIIED